MTHDPSDEVPRISDPHESETIAVSIDEALANNWVDIWYQPKIDLKRKCLAGAETLVRLHHPQAGLLWPEDYLNLLDEDDLATLVEHTLRTTLRNWSTFDEAGFGLRLAINVPATMLSRLPVKALIAEHCAGSKNWPGLILEVTEDQIVRDIALTRKIATELKASRVEIAIDDFGAGFSSFSSLRDLPFAELKLHGSFVKNCAVDVTNAAICQTAIDLAHRFGSMAAAKGIDSIADLQALMVMGCDFGQGMLVAPPMPQDRFLEALQQHMNRPGASQPQTDEKAERIA
ncbi:MAG TPA: EAL domain-containing protein [Pseudolabrys sp.]|nr:EAL domain-containing protein [Pseudolabrys sp.]